jgi:hypothetical protein
VVVISLDLGSPKNNCAGWGDGGVSQTTGRGGGGRGRRLGGGIGGGDTMAVEEGDNISYGDGDEEEDGMEDLEALKARALASAPMFGGGSRAPHAAAAAAPPALSPARKARVGGNEQSPDQLQVKSDVCECVRVCVCV